MKITLVQSRGLVMDPTVNFFKARMRINNVESDMFILPEMFCSGYVGQREKMALDLLDDRIVKKLSELSVNRGCAIICGCPRKDGDDLYDSALLISGKEITEYRKMILGNDGAVDEPSVFKAGNRPMIIDHMGLNIGMSIGNDLLSPELYKYYADNDVDLLVCISAFNEKQMDRFDKIVKSRAAENCLPVILCNMVGPDCGENLIGRSKYIGPDGTVIEGCTESSDVRVLNVDVDMLKESKKGRRILPTIEFGECIRCKSESGEGANPNPTCPITGH